VTVSSVLLDPVASQARSVPAQVRAAPPEQALAQALAPGAEVVLVRPAQVVLMQAQEAVAVAPAPLAMSP
jgi:hypothetical protein